MSFEGVCAFTSVCEEDAKWIPQYIAEAERLQLRFAMHLDRCSQATKSLVRSCRLCVGTTCQDDHSIEFDERHKQDIHDLVARYGFQWSMAWDIDETHETGAGDKIETILGEATRDGITTVNISLLTLWDDWKYIRVDPPFGGGRRSCFNYLDVKLKFLNGQVNGPTRIDGKGRKLPYKEVKYDLKRLHWGMLTENLRKIHKARWDRIYAQFGGNKYGIWKESLNPKLKVEVEEHNLLNHLPPDYRTPIE